MAAAEDAADLAALAKLDADDSEEDLPDEMVARLLSGGNPIRVWREYRKLSTAELAETSGISKAYLAQLEGGERQGTLTTLKRLAAALSVSIDDLV